MFSDLFRAEYVWGRKGNNTYIQSEAGITSVKTKKDGSALIQEPAELTATYGQKLSDIILPDGWTWADLETAVSVGAQTYTARFDTTSYEDEYDFTDVDGYNADGHYVELNLSVNTAKADTMLAFTNDNMDKIYDGKAVSNPDIKKTGSTKDVSFVWYVKDGDNWKELSSAPINTGSYKVIAGVEADENYNSATAEREFAISQTTNEWTSELSITGWTYGQNANTPAASAKYGDVTFTYSDEKSGTYTDTVPTEAGTWYVKATVTGNANYTGLEEVQQFEIRKADSKITFAEDFSLDKNFDGKEVKISTDDVTKTGSTKEVAFTWQKKNGDDWMNISSSPVNVGSYRIVASVAEDTNYNGTSAYLEFSISQTANEWTEGLSITGWTYGEEPNEPTAKAMFGKVSFTYSDKEDGTFDDAVPTEAGTWYVKAAVAGNENYTELEEVKSFTIAKAIPSYTLPEDLIIKQGEALSTVELPAGFTWNDETQTADDLGTHTFKGVFMPEDTANYQTVEVDISIEVVPAVTPVNHVPVITAEDRTLTVGDTFNPLEEVTAADTEDGDLTEKIEVINNEVDTSKAGTYEVTYEVTDSQGAGAVKTITVTVKEKDNAQGSGDSGDTDSSDTTTGSSADKGSGEKATARGEKQTGVETGDSSNMIVWAALMFVSVLGAVLSVRSRRRMRR